MQLSKDRISCWVLLVVATVLQQQQGASAFSIQKTTTTPQSDRRNFLKQAFGTTCTFGVVLLLPSAPASAKAAAEEAPPPTRELVTNTFAPIKYELLDPDGGVAYMQGRIDEQDWLGLMDFTRTYDLEMRKLRMGRAKRLLQSKELKLKGTEFCNAVTFDLIGMNRSSRSGQESVESANKYLEEMRVDINKFLELESTILVEG
jgi:hypothetical protein